MKIPHGLRHALGAEEPSPDPLDGSLSIGLACLPMVQYSDLCVTDDGFNNFSCSKNRLVWQESIAIEQLKTVHWLAIGESNNV